jgi:biopolymer transport protein ExbB
MGMMIKHVIALLVLMSLPLSASAWWNDAWSFRKELIVDTSQSGANLQESVAEFPLLVRLHTGNFGYFLDMLQDGADLRFIAGDDTTPLKFHIEKFDPINELAFVWVKLPRLNAGANGEKIWMYYGNTAAKGGQDAAGTYDVNQVLVYHFDELSAGPHDRTAYGNHPSSSDTTANPASLIGPGVQFDGLEQRNIVPVTPSMRIVPAQGWTFSGWVKPAAAEDRMILMEVRDGDRVLNLTLEDGAVHARYTDGTASVETNPSKVADPLAWHHLALALKDDTLKVYVDGQSVASAQGVLAEMGGSLILGGSGVGAGFQGEMDEVQVSNTLRDGAWLLAANRSQGVGSALLVYGGDEKNELAGGGSSYFGIILQNVTLDGWVVIVLLGVMGAISWVVMVGKWLLIGRVRKDDREFLRQYREQRTGEPDRLDQEESEEDEEYEDTPLTQALFGKHDHFQSSSLYRIYHAGIQEVHARVSESVGSSAAALSPQAINSIRAVLDATQVRETQKLTNMIVLLTIAISGGPFLGLLGTVVGVMITFAAIAASGDVNVNAIAPGIAAALMATVAGLAVAIPSLFAYNYLNTKIKETRADMQVFVDEFIAKIAEHYA